MPRGGRPLPAALPSQAPAPRLMAAFGRTVAAPWRLPLPPPSVVETLEHIGYARTYSKTNTITDSSAAASAYACGEKFVNNEVCFQRGPL